MSKLNTITFIFLSNILLSSSLVVIPRTRKQDNSGSSPMERRHGGPSPGVQTTKDNPIDLRRCPNSVAVLGVKLEGLKAERSPTRG